MPCWMKSGGNDDGKLTKTLGPAAAHFESIARSRPPDHHNDLAAVLPQWAGYLLDAGCASGRLTLQFAQRSDFAVGMDLSADLIEIARGLERAQALTNIAWVVGDMERPPFQSDSFDLVVSTNAIRLTNVPVSLEQLARLVKPGGRFAIQDILANRHGLRVFLFPYFFRTLRGAPRYLRLYGPMMLLRILGYRLSRVELRRAIRVDRLTFDVLEEIYHRVMPGSMLQTDRWGYLAIWDKPSNAKVEIEPSQITGA